MEPVARLYSTLDLAVSQSATALYGAQARSLRDDLGRIRTLGLVLRYVSPPFALEMSQQLRSSPSSRARKNPIKVCAIPQRPVLLEVGQCVGYALLGHITSSFGEATAATGPLN
jgi:hypothetical protein